MSRQAEHAMMAIRAPASVIARWVGAVNHAPNVRLLFKADSATSAREAGRVTNATGAIPAMQGQIAIDAMSAGSPKPIYWARCAVFVNREDGADTVNCAAIALNTTPSEPAGTTTGTRPMYTMPSCARLKGPPARTSTIATPSIARDHVS